GSMAGQAMGHVVQCSVPALKPDTILWWAGSTLGLADLNRAEFNEVRFTDYPRVWWHACEDAIFPKQTDIEKKVRPGSYSNGRRSRYKQNEQGRK
ncbi:TPA: hypothetical protein ACVTEX_004863, partial [Salmonella enterica subsp. salamae]